VSSFVLDASVAAVWLFDDEGNSYAAQALMQLEQGSAIVPQLWHFEIRNCLLVAERKKRITQNDSLARLDALNDLPIQTDMEPDFDIAFGFARKYALSFYDALYLELASRLQIPLASLDKQLIGAASSSAGEDLPLL